MRASQTHPLSNLPLLLLVGCGSGSSAGNLATDEEPTGNVEANVPETEPMPRDAAAADAGATGGSSFSPGDGGTPAQVSLDAVGEPNRLTDDARAIAGMTDDGYVIYRSTEGLSAVPVDGNPTPTLVTKASGSVVIDGPIVFHWADVDWEAMSGDLTIWSSEAGSRDVGTTLFGDDAVAVSESGERVLYYTNLEGKTRDLMIASPEMSSPTALVEDVGRGDESTCRASARFVGDQPVVAWCAPGTKDASLQQFSYDGNAWKAKTITETARPLWSADASGDNLLFVTSGSQAKFFDGTESHLVDTSVGWATLLPQGSAVLYTVGDQLRRSPVPNAAPMTVVVNDFVAQAAFSPSWKYALYSTEITYEGGTRRDLYLARTDERSATSRKLVPEPTGAIPRSAFTSEGSHVLYLDDVTDAGPGVLHVNPVSGGEAKTFADVDTVIAAPGNRIVFSSSRSDPTDYPIVADLRLFHPSASAPVLIRAGVSSGRDVYLTPDGSKLAYVMPRDDEPDEDAQGLYVQPLF